mgnify:CR=1 FL=1
MKRLLYIALLLTVACTQAYLEIDNPNHSSTAEDRKIIDYIDQRLIEEYYWLDEVAEKKGPRSGYAPRLEAARQGHGDCSHG